MNLRKLLKRMGAALVRTGVLLTIAAFLLAVLLWFVGPMIAFGEVRPLQPLQVRLVLLLVIALAWGIGGLFMRGRRNSQDQALISALRRQQDEERAMAERDDSAAQAEFRNFRDAAAAAMRFVQKGRGGLLVNNRYALPWYLVLGRDGVGKTSLIRHSGLALPYQNEAAGPEATAGFHVSDKAVLVDIAGRLIDQPERRDSTLWLRMLDFLRQIRSQQPINGIIVAIGADDLISMSPEQGLDYASGIRRRLDETIARLRTRAPVYLAITKLDLIVGFEEYFETLNAEERIAVLGIPLAQPSPQGASFADGFADIVDRLSEQHLLRLQEEPDELRRRRILEFPAQFALLGSKLDPIVQHATAGHQFGSPPLVRGVFFTSATQNLQSRDMLAGVLSEDFAQQPDRLALRHETGSRHSRPFFLQGLVRDVILPEAYLGGLTRPALLLTRIQGVAANVVLTFFAFLLVGLWWIGFSEGRAYSGRLDDGVAQTRISLAESAPDGQLPTSFEPVLAVLDDLRRLSEEEPRRAAYGLYSTHSVDSASRDAYDKALRGMLFPFVWRYLRDGLDNPETPAALRFHQLKLYLMLGGVKPAEPDVAAILGPDFASRWVLYDRSAELDGRVSAHLAELAAAELDAPAIDLALVDRARSRISDYTLARLAYDTALTLPAVKLLPVWRPVDHMGMSGPQALARISGSSFWDGIPGIYTEAGFNNVMSSLSGTVADGLAADLWVMAPLETSIEQETQRIREGLLDLYRVDYITQWDSLLSDLGMIDGARANDVVRAMGIIIGNPSPVKELIVAIADQTNLAPEGAPLLDAVPGATAQLQQLNTTVLFPRRIVNVGKAVTDHFQALRDAIAAEEGQQSQVDALLVAMEPLYRQMNHVATGGDILELGAEPQALLNSLTEQTNALPPSLQPLFRRILSQAAAVTSGNSRERLAEIWTSTVLPVCQATTAGRYPFEVRSREDSSLQDFAALFGPKGAIASFRNDYLKPFIDTTTKPWRWRTGQQVGLGYGDDVLSGFELANDITLAYFGEADLPSVSFIVEPIRLDPRARAFQFDTGGPTLVYTHGPSTAAAMRWPPEKPGAEASLSMTPEVDGERNVVRRQGEWALFRLFDTGRILDRNPTDVVPYGFTIGSRQVVLQVTAPATKNPFARDILSGFRCPVL